MKKSALQKSGYILSDIKTIPAGISKSSGKEHGEMFLFTVLEQGATETTTFFTNADFAEEIQAVIDTLDYLAPVTITGEQSGNKFIPNMIEPV